jgi:integrase
MPRKSGEGWLRVKRYADGQTVLFCFQTRRSADGRLVENTKRVGLLRDFPSEKAQWMEVSRLSYQELLDRPIGSCPTFRELAEHWRKHELKKDSGVGKKAPETVSIVELILDNWILPRWGEMKAGEIKPLGIEAWFNQLTSSPQGKKNKPLGWGTIQKLKSIMSQVYRHAQRYELIPVSVDAAGRPSNPLLLVRSKSSSEYEAKVISPEQMIVILAELEKPETRMEWTLAVLHASTALRPEESFGLKWSDIDWESGQIHIRRGWSKGKETDGKNAGSMSQVPMHPVLAQCLQDWRKESLYFGDSDWVFASIKAKGRIPRTASICAQDYLRPAAIKAGVITKGYKGRFGWHNCRHSLASFCGANEIHPAVTQSILRHKKLSTTMEVYTHHVNSVQMAAQEKFLKAIGLTPPTGNTQ